MPNGIGILIFTSMVNFMFSSVEHKSCITSGPDNNDFHLGLLCLPMSHKKDARLIWVNEQ